MQRILILEADRICASALRVIAERVFPFAEFVLANRIETARQMLGTAPADLLIAGLELPDGDALDFIHAAARVQERVTRVLVVAEHHEPRVLELLREWQIEGVFDRQTGDSGSLEHALKTVAAGHSYWSSPLLQRLDARACGGRALSVMLTPAELALLGAIGDGSADEAAAAALRISPTTVRTLRRNLHRKLQLHHRSDVVRFAVQNGFVRFSHGLVMRPGFEFARAAYEARRQKTRSDGPNGAADAPAARAPAISRRG